MTSSHGLKPDGRFAQNRAAHAAQDVFAGVSSTSSKQQRKSIGRRFDYPLGLTVAAERRNARYNEHREIRLIRVCLITGVIAVIGPERNHLVECRHS
jgi:hypothetical protein